MEKAISKYYSEILINNGFSETNNDNNFCTMGKCWYLSEKIGKGIYWVYEQEGLYNIKIHDFYYNEDTIVDFNIPECLSISYFESISGEELIPYKRLEANTIKTFIGGHNPFKANIHKRIPVRSTGIEIFPAYYEDYLKNNFPGEYQSPYDAFCSVEGTSDFPEMILLLNQIKNYRGDGISAKLFYEAKVAEAVSLIIEFRKKKENAKNTNISDTDKELLLSVTAYLNDHYAFNVKLEQLAKIACMGTTKLKYSFKLMHGCTITEYIQKRRMSQAEHLLSCTNFPINQVAQTVGYKSASRFSELFRKSTGILPNEYRAISKSK